MRDVSRVRVVGPLAGLAEGFRRDLEVRGYSPFTVLNYLQLMGHLSRWLGTRRGGVAPLTASELDRYLRARRRAGYRRFLTLRAAGPLVDYLHRQGLLQDTGGQDGGSVSAAESLLFGFAEYLRVERGLADVTIGRRVFLARRILSVWEQGGLADLRDLTAADVTAFVLESSRTSNGCVSGVVTALRSLLRYLHLVGVIDRPLAAAVPAMASWKLTGLPKALSAEQVRAMLASCDRDSVVGRRDAAIVTILARLALRAGEVAALRLDDIDWRSGQITVRGKGNRAERLPMPFDVGDVLVAYLTDGHPGAAAAGQAVFARVRAPHGRLTRGAVTQIVARAAQRAGFEPFYAHRLRHTAATEMLRGGGCLDEIGQVLRHHHRSTTAIYAKVDIEALRTVARPWPGTMS